MAKAARKIVPVLEPSLDYEVVLVTPAMATEWLKHNHVNRRLAKSTWKAWARDMAAGRWLLDGAPIRFNDDGDLIDGQHRLKACVEANVPFWTVVIRNLAQATMRVMDCGRMRSLADEMAFEGFKAATRTAAACRWLYYIKHQNIRDKERITRPELWALIERHQQLQESGLLVYKAMAMPPALLAAFHYIGAYILGNGQLANQFALVFSEGMGFYEDDAALVWHKKLLHEKIRRNKISSVTLLHGTIHAWNNFAGQRAPGRFQVPENPAIEGLDLSKL